MAVDVEPNPYAPSVRFRRIAISVTVLSAELAASVLLSGWAGEATGSRVVQGLAALLLPMAITFLLAPHASYRRRDSLLCLTGIGLWVFAVVVWRAAYLPYRDWRPRPEESTYADWIRSPEYAGIWRLDRGNRERARH